MKTLKTFKILFLLTLTAFLANCGKTSSSGSSTATAATSYYYSNGLCYSAAAGQTVNTAYCSTSTTTGSYYYYNGYCYSATLGQIVNTSYCQNTTTSTGTTGQQCYGYYYYLNNGYYQTAYCTGSNCRGYTLLSATTQQWVSCQ